MSKKKQQPHVRTGREQAAVMSAHGANLLLDRQAHRQRVIPDKRKEAGRRACREWR